MTMAKVMTITQNHGDLFMLPRMQSPLIGSPILDLADEWEQAQRYWATHTHCRYCGRELVDSIELDSLRNPTTGEREVIIWRQCPRFPKNGWIALLRGWCHDSARLDAPICGRTYG